MQLCFAIDRDFNECYLLRKKLRVLVPFFARSASCSSFSRSPQLRSFTSSNAEFLADHETASAVVRESSAFALVLLAAIGGPSVADVPICLS